MNIFQQAWNALFATRSNIELIDLTEDIKSDKSPVLKMINLILLQGVDQEASEIHLFASNWALEVFYRIKGDLKESVSPPRDLYPALRAQLQRMASVPCSGENEFGEILRQIHGRIWVFRPRVIKKPGEERIEIDVDLKSMN